MVATVALYAHSLSGESVYEDVRQPLALSLGSRTLSRSLVWLTQQVSLAPWAGRSVSLALHLVNGALVWRLASAVLPEIAAVVACALVLWHPLNTEAVAYAANQPELLVALCTLAALLLADRSRVLAWLACGCAVLAKEPGIVAFLLVPAWMAVRGRWSARACVAWIALSTLPALACWPIVAHHGNDVPVLHTVALNLAAVGWLATKFVVPIGLTVLPDWWWLTPTAITLCLAGWMFVYAVGAGIPTLSVLASFVLLSVLPRLLWVLPGGLHEHHLYLASVALSIGAAGWLSSTHWRFACTD